MNLIFDVIFVYTVVIILKIKKLIKNGCATIKLSTFFTKCLLKSNLTDLLDKNKLKKSFDLKHTLITKTIQIAIEENSKTKLNLVKTEYSRNYQRY